MRSWRETDGDDTVVGYAIAALGPIAVAGALTAVRDDIEHTTAVLLLVVVVVLGAMAGGRAAGALGAVVAALSFDFFLTQPYLTLRIDSEADVETTLVLLVIGLLVGQIVVLARRHRREVERAADAIARMQRVAEQSASGASPDDLVLSVEAELIGLMGLRGCTFQRDEVDDSLPRIERSGAVTATHHRLGTGGEFALPAGGAELPVVGGGRTLGHFLLRPDPERGVSLEARVVAVALADQLGAALARTNGPVPSE